MTKNLPAAHHSALIGRSAYLELDLLDGTADLRQQLFLRRQRPLEAGDRAELLDVLDTLPLADAILLLRAAAQVVARECWTDERLWESPADAKYRRCRAERDRQPATPQREVS